MKSYIKNDELDTSIKKIRMYQNSLDLDYERIERNLREMLYYFDTKNKEKFDLLNEEISNKNNVICTMHHQYIEVLDKTVQNYIELARKVAEDFKNGDLK